jgi:hypothetical protein
MRAPLAAIAADRISHSAILVAGVLCGALVFFVAIPLALSNPFPALKEAEWVIQRSSLRVNMPTSEMVEAQALFDPVPSMPAPQAALWEFVALPAHGSLAFVPPEVTGAEATGSIAETAPPVRQARSTMDEVDEYLWEVYRRAPSKRDSTGDFTWKDPAAAKRLGMSMPTYVIGGMDLDFREQLYHAGRAMDAAGVRWALLSAFRDDYRQSPASGFKAGASNSLHGGKARVGGMAMAKPLTLPARTAIRMVPCGAGSTVMAPSTDCAARCRGPTRRIFNPAATGTEPPSHCATPASGPSWRKPKHLAGQKSSRPPGKPAGYLTADRRCARSPLHTIEP